MVGSHDHKCKPNLISTLTIGDHPNIVQYVRYKKSELQRNQLVVCWSTQCCWSMRHSVQVVQASYTWPRSIVRRFVVVTCRRWYRNKFARYSRCLASGYIMLIWRYLIYQQLSLGDETAVSYSGRIKNQSSLKLYQSQSTLMKKSDYLIVIYHIFSQSVDLLLFLLMHF